MGIRLWHLSHAITRTVRLTSVLILAVQGAHLPVDNHAGRILSLIIDPAEAKVLRFLKLASSRCPLILHHLNSRLVNLGVFDSLVD